MSKLIFVESSFQLQLANEIKGTKYILYVKKSLILRLIYIPKFIMLILINKHIYIYDYRNPILILAIIVNFFIKKKIYIVDDGFHSILVDKFQEKYLYRETNFGKRFFMRLFKSRILKTKRLKQINFNFKKQVLLPDYKNAVFLDQGDFELLFEKKIKHLESKYYSFEFAKHPRSKKYNLFNYSNNSFQNLIDPKIKKDFYGVCSTGLIYALKNNHNVFLINVDSIKSDVSCLEFNYIKDIQDILIDLGAKYEVA